MVVAIAATAATVLQPHLLPARLPALPPPLALLVRHPAAALAASAATFELPPEEISATFRNREMRGREVRSGQAVGGMALLSGGCGDLMRAACVGYVMRVMRDLDYRVGRHWIRGSMR